MDSSNITHDYLMERLDNMARNIDMYRQLLDTAITDHRKEIIVKCQVRWMQRYIKLAEIIF